ncbi:MULTISPECIES: nuclear transport factor 2 family protein [unclassified Citrobacter]|uniref:nuclear transport factor 2 family protein n=1 Tax=unclassified Citrobacter TaxID=2644389 RepID=UPI00230296CC|nr:MULTISPECIES: nuclear transport factor 2 family protein [unclassified Citrobacter]MDA8501973.1 nuclear transport factor 2 family protein [Citrobacter sp. Awk 2]MEB2420448.1 nuclear transport factor 2 family protein [Citrobacter sp. R-1.5.2]
MTESENAVAIVKAFLVASMIPDAERAATFTHPEVKITFTGRREMAGAADIARFNGERYKWVKKALGEFDAVAHEDCVVVYSNGTLYGEWPDGRAFAGNRYIDRFEVREGKITHMDVWNDSAEWILAPEISRLA